MSRSQDALLTTLTSFWINNTKKKVIFLINCHYLDFCRSPNESFDLHLNHTKKSHLTNSIDKIWYGHIFVKQII